MGGRDRGSLKRAGAEGPWELGVPRTWSDSECSTLLFGQPAA